MAFGKMCYYKKEFLGGVKGHIQGEAELTINPINEKNQTTNYIVLLISKEKHAAQIAAGN